MEWYWWVLIVIAVVIIGYIKLTPRLLFIHRHLLYNAKSFYEPSTYKLSIFFGGKNKNLKKFCR